MYDIEPMALVLIVDDEVDLAHLVEFGLQHAGLETCVALSGADALESIRLRVPEVVVLDLMLPDMSGREVCRLMREDSRLRQTAIIMLTACGEESDRVRGFEVGADDYVTKPFSPRELVLRVQAILRRSAVPFEQPIRLSLGPLRIELDSHRAWVAEQPLDLTAIEFKLLRQFLANPGRIQSRERLLAEVWGIISPVETRTVDTHLTRLREKLGPASVMVETVRGVGYRMTA